MPDIEISQVLRLPAAHDDTSPGVGFALRPCTTHSVVEVWDGTAWTAWTVAGVGAASEVSFTPTGTLAATDVQAAVAELDGELAARVDTVVAAAGLLDAEGVMDLLGSTGLAEGDNITLGYDDATGVITVSATGGAGGGGLLARKVHDPATIENYTTSSTTAVDVDTDLVVTFTVPASGTVEVELQALAGLNGTVYDNLSWTLQEGSTTVAGPGVIVHGGSEANDVYTRKFVITGLTPGAVKTYTWGWQVLNAATVGRMYAGGVADQVIMTVRD